jgi:hypothetical protein
MGWPAYSTGIVGATGPSGGVATVYVDGVAKGKIDFYSRTVKSRKVLYVNGDAAVVDRATPAHAISIVRTSMGSGGGTSMTLDAVAFDPCCGDCASELAPRDVGTPVILVTGRDGDAPLADVDWLSTVPVIESVVTVARSLARHGDTAVLLEKSDGTVATFGQSNIFHRPPLVTCPLARL